MFSDTAMLGTGNSTPSSKRGIVLPPICTCQIQKTITCLMAKILTEILKYIYIDGACKRNGMASQRKTGYGVFYGNGDVRNAAVSSSNADKLSGTNQRSELRALYHAIINIVNDINDDGTTKAYTIHTDSKYVIRASGIWAKKWKSNGWRTTTGRVVANQDLIKRIVFYLKEINERLANIGLPPVKIEYVPGHAGNHGNEMADKLANKAADEDGEPYWL